MTLPHQTAPPVAPALTNGSGAAAVLAAGMGSFALAVLACLADKEPVLSNLLTFYKPTGSLSGVTTSAILIWIVSWFILEWRWRSRTVAIGRIAAVALALLGLSLLLTFPPVVDVL